MKHVLSVLVQNQPRVLVRVASMFSRRDFNIDSLAVGETQSPAYSRITVVVRGDQQVLRQVIKQLEKMVEVVAVKTLSADQSVLRGMALLKVNCPSDQRAEVLKLADVFRARVVDVKDATLTFEITGDEEKINAFAELVNPYGVLELIRTGLVGLQRGENTIYQCDERNDEHGKNVL